MRPTRSCSRPSDSVANLAGAYVRLFRAFERLADLTDEVYRQGGELLKASDDQGNLADIDSVSPMTTIFIGEIVLNLRGALDHLAYQLVLRDTGAPQPNTCFPLSAADGQVFEMLSPAHADSLTELQPDRGVAWTRTLLALSDPYRQRHLLLITPPAAAAATLPGMANDTRVLAFDDGTPVISTLGELGQQVSRVLDSFNPEFLQG